MMTVVVYCRKFGFFIIIDVVRQLTDLRQKMVRKKEAERKKERRK